MSTSMRSFHPADIALFSLTLALSLAVGIYHGFRRRKSGGRGGRTAGRVSGEPCLRTRDPGSEEGNDRTTGAVEEYLVAGRRLPVVPVAVSMFMSYVSAVMVLGNTAEMYTAGIQYWLASLGSVLAFVFAAVVFVPLFFPLKFISGNQYYEERFGSKAVRVWSAIMFILSSIVYMGLTMFTPATALNAATQFPVWGSIIATGLIATIYTTLGGMKAVVWTDTIQGGIMVAGIIAVLIAGSAAVGGISRIWQISADGGRLKIFDFNPDPTVRLTFWSVIFGRFFISLNYVAGQTAIQRYSTLRTLRDARLSALLNAPAIVLMYTLTCLCGLTVYAYYANKGCDPLRNKEINSSNQLLPYFIMEVVNYPGLPGVFIAVLFSGALSSISSSLNSMAACTWKDLLEWRLSHIPDSKKALINKLLVAVYGSTAIGMAFVASTLGGHVLQATQSIVGGFGGPALGLFFLGSFFPWSNWQGALFGSLTGFAMTAWVSLGAYITRAGGFGVLPTSIDNCTVANATDSLTTPDYITMTTLGPTSTPPPNYVLPIYKMSYMYNAGWGCLITVITGLIISFITGPTKPSTVDSKLLVPVFDRLCCCLPERWRKHCRCASKDRGEEEEEAAEAKQKGSRQEKRSNVEEQKDFWDHTTPVNRAYLGQANMGYQSTKF